MEHRLIKTHLSKRPLNGALTITASVLLLSTLLSLVYWNSTSSLSLLLPANGQNIFKDHEYWRLLTTTFIHGDFRHLLSNAYMLSILSFFCVGYFGKMLYPFTAFLFGALINAFTIFSMPENIYLIGASGVVYWLAGFWLTIYIFIERQKSLLQRIVRSLGVALMTLFPSTLEPQVSYKAHAYGFLFGVLYAVFYFYKNKNIIRSSEQWISIEDTPFESNTEWDDSTTDSIEKNSLFH